MLGVQFLAQFKMMGCSLGYLRILPPLLVSQGPCNLIFEKGSKGQLRLLKLAAIIRLEYLVGVSDIL